MSNTHKNVFKYNNFKLTKYMKDKIDRLQLQADFKVSFPSILNMFFSECTEFHQNVMCSFQKRF